MRSTEVRLASRPHGMPTAETFAITETEVGEPGPGQVLVRNLLMSVDPYMRGRMNDVKSYTPPFKLGEPLEGAAVGSVVAVGEGATSQVGDTVLHSHGWREYALLNARHTTTIDTSPAPLSAFLGVLGMPGLTAYAGLFVTAEFKAGDTVFVSSAAGAVGQVAGQLAKLNGAARVIGSAGSPAKVAYLTEELGFDAAFDYHDGKARDLLAAAAPEGIDVYFDNVGGEQLEAAIGAMKLHGRITACGMISVYNATEPVAAPRNLAAIIGKRITMRGMLVVDHYGLEQKFLAEVAPLVADGRIKHQETIFDGLRSAPEAFLAMLKGDGVGKVLVNLQPS
jgi:NADPH-dependent curcumin reductase CurA